MAQGLGLRVPRSVILHSVDELPAALDEVGLPAVVKPIRSWAESSHGSQRVVSELVVSERRSRKGRRTPDDIWARRSPSSNSCWAAASRSVSCTRTAPSMCVFHLGAAYGTAAGWHFRPLAADRAARRYPAQAERLIRAIGLEGFCKVEFRRGADGHPYLMEINARLTADLGLAVSLASMCPICCINGRMATKSIS